MGIILSSSSSLKSMSLVITIIVILFIVLSFIGLFFLVTHFFKKCINLGLEDNLVKKEILSEYKEYFEEAPDSTKNEIKIVEIKNVIKGCPHTRDFSHECVDTLRVITYVK